MSDLQPMLTRDRYGDQEWELASAGKCPADLDSEAQLTLCGKPSDPTSYYRFCTTHDAEARKYSPYGS